MDSLRLTGKRCMNLHPEDYKMLVLSHTAHLSAIVLEMEKVIGEQDCEVFY